MTFNVNGVCEISFDPNDRDFAERVFSTICELDKRHTRVMVSASAFDAEKNYDLFREESKEIMQRLCNLLGVDIYSLLFPDGNISCSTELIMMAGGTPVWFNILFGVVEMLDCPPSWYCQKVISKYLKKRGV